MSCPAANAATSIATAASRSRPASCGVANASAAIAPAASRLAAATAATGARQWSGERAGGGGEPTLRPLRRRRRGGGGEELRERCESCYCDQPGGGAVGRVQPQKTATERLSGQATIVLRGTGRLPQRARRRFKSTFPHTRAGRLPVAGRASPVIVLTAIGLPSCSPRCSFGRHEPTSGKDERRLGWLGPSSSSEPHRLKEGKSESFRADSQAVADVVESNEP